MVTMYSGLIYFFVQSFLSNFDFFLCRMCNSPGFLSFRPCLVRGGLVLCCPLISFEFLHQIGGVKLDGHVIKQQGPDSQTFFLCENAR